MDTRPSELVLVYDGECPVCDAYCRRVRVRPEAGSLRLVNAREPDAIIDEISSRGLDVDQGMVLKAGGALYYGSDAIHALALLSSRSGIFNRMNYWLLRSRGFSRLLYPVARCLRNLLLKTLRRSKVNNLGLENNKRF